MGKVLKGFVLLSLTILVVLFGLYIYLNQKERLNVESKELLTLSSGYQPNLKEHPYFMLIGLNAKPILDPMILGRLKYHNAWAEHLSVNILGEVLNPTVYVAEIKYPQFESSALDHSIVSIMTKLRENKDPTSKVQLIQINKEIIKQAYIQYEYLIQRYLNARQDSHYETLMQSPRSDLIETSLMANLHYLYISHLILENKKQDLINYIKILQSNYQTTYHLIDRMILTSFLVSSLDFLHIIGRGDVITEISDLTKEQLSFKSVLATDLQSYNLNFIDLDSALQSEEKFLKFNWPTVKLLFLKSLYDHKANLNLLAEALKPYIELSELPYSQFKNKVNEEIVFTKPKFVLKNYLGWEVLTTNQPEYKKYLVKVNLMNHKFIIFNILHSGQPWNINELNQNKHGYEFYLKNEQLCIKSPYLKKHDFNVDSCLKV